MYPAQQISSFFEGQKKATKKNCASCHTDDEDNLFGHFYPSVPNMKNMTVVKEKNSENVSILNMRLASSCR